MSVKSVLVTNFGGYETLTVANYPLEDLKNEDVQVEVHYCGLNFADLYSRQGLMPKDKFPFIIGIECSGIIKAIGKSVSNFKINDRVVCYDYNGGLYRNTVVISAKKCYTIPDNISLKEASCLFVNYLTAYFSINDLGSVQLRQHILIQSCAGGVGCAATQLANQIDGVKIYGTTSTNKTENVLANGVHHVLTYKNYKEELKLLCEKGVDLIIDNQSGDDFESNLQLLKPFGKIIVIGANKIIADEKQLNPEKLRNIQSTVNVTNLIVRNIGIFGLHLGILAESNPILIQETFNKICSLLTRKVIHLMIDSVWPLDKIISATTLLQERKNVGKVLLMTDNVKCDV